jgi:hypothetical protein
MCISGSVMCGNHGYEQNLSDFPVAFSMRILLADRE